jgi:hypothetical protein
MAPKSPDTRAIPDYPLRALLAALEKTYSAGIPPALLRARDTWLSADCPGLITPCCSAAASVPGEEVAKLQSQLAQMVPQVKAAFDAMDLLATLLDDEECRFDHHGNCQEHLDFRGGGQCVMQDVRNLLARWDNL